MRALVSGSHRIVTECLEVPQKVTLKGWHIMILGPSAVVGGSFGWIAAGWGGMIGAGVSAALGGAFGCLILQRALEKRRLYR